MSFDGNDRVVTGLVLIGEAPGRPRDPSAPQPSLPLGAPATRRKLEWLFGAEAYGRALKFNLLSSWPGKAGKGDLFDVGVAAPAMITINRALDGIAVEWTVVLLGFRVAETMTANRPHLREYFKPWSAANRTYVIIPHPSGVNRWWNEDANRFRAVRACRKIGRETL